MNYLSIPNFTDPQGPAPITAYGAVAAISADFLGGKGHFVLAIYRSLTALQAGSAPMAYLTITAGGQVTPGQPRRSPPSPTRPGPAPTGPTFPTLTQIATAESTAWAAIWQYLLTQAATLAALTGATVETA